MKKANERLRRLAALTRGAAILGLGMGTATSCAKSDATAQAASAESAGGAALAPSDAGSPRFPYGKLPVPNAVHPSWRVNGDGGGASGGSGTP